MLTSGVMEARGADAGVAWHYGNPVAEARALARGVGLVDQSQMDVVTVTGPERLTWLHLFASQHLAQLAPGVSTETLILSAPGQIEHAAAVIDDGATTWLITDAGRGAPLVAFLDSMRFAARVEAAVRDDLAVVAVQNTAHTPGELLALLDDAVASWQDPWPTTTGTTYGPADDAHPAAGWDRRLVVVEREGLEDLARRWTETGGVLAGAWASEAARIAAWRPRLATETDERTIPHELDWIRTAVHLDKGCYRGQETVARVITLGRPPRRLVFLHLDGSAEALPVSGDAVMAGGREVGRVTSAAHHHELGPIALAVVKRSVAVDADLTVMATVDDHDAITDAETDAAAGAGEPAQSDAAARTVEVAASQQEIVAASGASAATPAERPGAGLRASGARKPLDPRK